ncbi:MAG: hypothetical protein AAB972_02120, partial [Patescibacteria group bacterium]
RGENETPVLFSPSAVGIYRFWVYNHKRGENETPVLFSPEWRGYIPENIRNPIAFEYIIKLYGEK